MAVGTLATIATIVEAAAAAASIAGTAYAATQKGPTAPNAASSSREVAQAQAQALPKQRQLAAQEQQGGKFTQYIPKHKEAQQMVKVPTDNPTLFDRTFSGDPSVIGKSFLAIGSDLGAPGLAGFLGFGQEQRYTYIPYNADDWKAGGKYNKDGKLSDDWGTKHVVTKNITVPAHQETSDFKGYGTADIESKLASQMTDIQQQLGEKYGTDFAQEALREARQADPEGFAARDKELELIQKGITNPPPISPLASTLDQRMQDRLAAGPGLDSMSKDLLDKSVAQANAARGGSTSADDVSRLMSTGFEGNARQQQALTQAQGWLSSGATPEDVQYKREQQNLANLGGFVSGQSPESQFASLSGAGQGAAPFYPGQQLPQQPNNASTVGSQFGVDAYLAGLKAQQGQANPWLAGLSSILSATNAGASAFAPSPNPSHP